MTSLRTIVTAVWLAFASAFVGVFLVLKVVERPVTREVCVVLPGSFEWPEAADYHDGGWWIDGVLVAVAASEDTEACMTPRRIP